MIYCICGPDHEDDACPEHGHCPDCGTAGHRPYPNGDRPSSSNPMRSGCDTCGSCY